MELIEAGYEKFNSVKYIPYSELTLNIDTNVTYEKINTTSFDAVLPRIPRDRSLLGYLFLRKLNSYSLIGSRAFLLTSDRFLMMSLLREKGMRVPNMYFLDSVKDVENIISGGMKFPLCLRIPGEKGIAIAGNKKEAKSVIGALKTFKKPVYAESFVSEPYIEAFVIGRKVAASIRKKPEKKDDIFHGHGKAKPIKLNEKTRKIVLNAANILKTDFALVRLTQKSQKIITVNLMPDLLKPSKITGINLSAALIDYIAENVSMERETGSSIERFLKATGKKFRKIILYENIKQK